ncbi:hypothetical protein Ciccas_012960, partial [Cichlidogyrus casuarinus]
ANLYSGSSAFSTIMSCHDEGCGKRLMDAPQGSEPDFGCAFKSIHGRSAELQDAKAKGRRCGLSQLSRCSTGSVYSPASARPPDGPGLVLDGIPNHSQAVERAVKLVTKSAEYVTGRSARDGNILQTIKARELGPGSKKPLQ